MPSQRLIRRQPFLQRLTSYPHDLFLSLNESWELLDWDTLSESFMIPIGLALNAVYIMTRLSQSASTSYRDKDVFKSTGSYDWELFQSSNTHTYTLVVSST
jgi:hypothetical protein